MGTALHTPVNVGVTLGVTSTLGLFLLVDPW
jgi:hypothetical protein